jgi:hypothetical protein
MNVGDAAGEYGPSGRADRCDCVLIKLDRAGTVKWAKESSGVEGIADGDGSVGCLEAFEELGRDGAL